MGRAITIRTDLGTPAELRGLAEREKHRRTALRLLGIANALDGMSKQRERPASSANPCAMPSSASMRMGSPGSWIGQKVTDASG